MKRSALILIGLATLLLVRSDARAAPNGHTPVITVVLSQEIEPYRQTLDGLQRAFQGRQPIPRFRVVSMPEEATAAGKASFLSDIDPDSDLIVAIGARAARALRGRNLGAPLMVAAGADSGTREGAPGADHVVAGVSIEFPFAQQFQVLRSVAPRARTIGTIYARENRPLVVAAAAAAKNAGLTLSSVEITSVKEIPAALDGLIGKVDALWALPDATVFSRETASYIILQTLRHRVPLMGFSQNSVKAGALVALYCDFQDVGLQAGLMARDILEGKRPASGESVPPRKALLAINLRVADVIGLTIPADVRKRANSIYE